MKHCTTATATAFALLIFKAFYAFGDSNGVILHLTHARLASPHVATQQLALSRTTSCLQSEASPQASDEFLECIGYKASETLIQFWISHTKIIRNSYENHRNIVRHHINILVQSSTLI